MTRFILGVILGLIVGVCLAAVSATAGTHWISTSGWLEVGDKKPPVLFMVVDCNGPCPSGPTPHGAVKMAGRSGDADAKVAAWLVRHDGQRIRVTWLVESPAGKDQ